MNNDYINQSHKLSKIIRDEFSPLTRSIRLETTSSSDLYAKNAYNILETFPSFMYNILYSGLVDYESPTEANYRLVTTYMSSEQHLIKLIGDVIMNTHTGMCVSTEDNRLRTIIDTCYTPSNLSNEAYFHNTHNATRSMLREIRTNEIERCFASDCEIQYPILSKYSPTYFHALSECVSQAFLISNYAKKLNKTAIGITKLGTSAVQSVAVNIANTFGTNCFIPKSKIVLASNVVLYTGFFKHASINSVFSSAIADIKNRLVKNSDRNKLLYISRINSNKRQLLNELELISAASALGYEIVDPGKLSFDEQVKLFSSARAVVGPHGSGLANAAFCGPGTVLIEFRPSHVSQNIPLINETYRRISAVQNLHYDFTISDTHTQEWTIDLNRHVKILQRVAKS